MRGLISSAVSIPSFCATADRITGSLDSEETIALRGTIQRFNDRPAASAGRLALAPYSDGISASGGASNCEVPVGVPSEPLSVQADCNAVAGYFENSALRLEAEHSCIQFCLLRSFATLDPFGSSRPCSGNSGQADRRPSPHMCFAVLGSFRQSCVTCGEPDLGRRRVPWQETDRFHHRRRRELVGPVVWVASPPS